MILRRQFRCTQFLCRSAQGKGLGLRQWSTSVGQAGRSERTRWQWTAKASTLRAGGVVAVPVCIWLGNSWCRPNQSISCEEVAKFGGAGKAPDVATKAAGYGLLSDGNYGPLSVEEAAAAHEEASKTRSDEEWPIVSLDELHKHCDADSLWVVYGGAVYDVTGYAKEHPGGLDTLLQAGGQDLAVIWQYYAIHNKTDQAVNSLKPYQVGRLSSEDAAALGTEGGPVEAAAAKHAGLISARHSRRRHLVMIATSLSASLWWSTRWLLRAVGALVSSRLVEVLASWLPCSVPGYGGASYLTAKDPKTGRQHSVAVIGGGIGGSSCAYSLTQSGFDVTVYEAREVLGGNAQVGYFPTSDGAIVGQDLSVVYWADDFYRNYAALLHKIGAKPADIQIPYVIHHTKANGETEYYVPPGFDTDIDKKLQPSMRPRFEKDFAKYDRMQGILHGMCRFFNYGDSRRSFYPPYFANLNPANFIGMRTCCRLFGMSDEFYTTVVQPFHGLNLTTIDIDNCPGTALAFSDDVMPMTRARWHRSWDTGNSQAVFETLTKDSHVELGARVRQVQPVRLQDGSWQQRVINDKGEITNFDRVVFACNAPAVASILRTPGWFERVFIKAVAYHDDFHRSDWKDWLEVPVHQDVTCLPESQRDVLLREAGFLIDVKETGAKDGSRNAEMTHCMGSWSPSAKSAGYAPGEVPMFMTQCLHADREIDPAKTLKTFSAPRGHPDLSQRNCMNTQFINLIQGRRGVYYCSNWACPGNGHDLSCVAGLVIANAIGAPYPLDDPDAHQDFKAARHFMGV